jgi:PEP-CTERM motif
MSVWRRAVRVPVAFSSLNPLELNMKSLQVTQVLARAKSTVLSALASVTLALSLAPSPAQAALQSRPGGMFYDTVLNVTWLQDWNYAGTSGYTAPGAPPGGKMTWDAANTWASNLVYGGHSNWRLPATVDIGNDGCNQSYAGTDCGFNPLMPSGGPYSEMAHLWYVTLGNKAPCVAATSTTTTCVPQPTGTSWGLQNAGPFSNMTIGPTTRWSGTQYAPSPTTHAWYFNTNLGSQFYSPYLNADVGFAVAVADGDIAAVPEPQTFALLGLGLLGVAVAKRRSLSASSNDAALPA